MTISKYQGRTEEEAVTKAKKELGSDIVIMNVRAIKPGGVLKFFKSPVYEITVAIEEKEQMFRDNPNIKSNIAIRDNINFTADEEIKIPVQTKKEPENSSYSEKSAIAPRMGYSQASGLEERIENLQNFLEKQLTPEDNIKKQPVEKKAEQPSQEQSEGIKFLKMIYSVMIDNEVDEKYANLILDDIEKVVRSGSNVDYILSNIYQKMILKFGQSKTIELTEKKPKVVIFIGPTGVGKTTTIAKIASKFKVDKSKNVAFLTADTYRIAAAEQLKTYANILDTPFSIVYAADEVNEAIANVSTCDLVLIDTAGFSHKSAKQRDETKLLIDSISSKYQKEIFLVVSATTKFKDLMNIADVYHSIADYKLIFTKLDETNAYGNLLNMKLYSGADLAYTTNGQNVPDDIEVFNTQKIVKQLLGGK